MPNNCRNCQQGGPCNMHKTNSCTVDNVIKTIPKAMQQTGASNPYKAMVKTVTSKTGKAGLHGKLYNAAYEGGKYIATGQAVYEQTCKKK